MKLFLEILMAQAPSSVTTPRGLKIAGAGCIASGIIAINFYSAVADQSRNAALGLAAFVTVLLLVGIVLVVISNIPPPTRRAFRNYSRRPMRFEELEQLHKLSAFYANGQVLDLATKQRFFHANPRIFWVIEVITAGGHKQTTGYILIYPLLRAAVDSLSAGKTSAASDLKIAHIAKSKKASGCYIGFVWGRESRYDRAAALQHLQEIISSLSARRRIFPVFGRPTSQESLRLARGNGFKSVKTGGDPQLWDVCFLSEPFLSV